MGLGQSLFPPTRPGFLWSSARSARGCGALVSNRFRFRSAVRLASRIRSAASARIRLASTRIRLVIRIRLSLAFVWLSVFVRRLSFNLVLSVVIWLGFVLRVSFPQSVIAVMWIQRREIISANPRSPLNIRDYPETNSI